MPFRFNKEYFYVAIAELFIAIPSITHIALSAYLPDEFLIPYIITTSAFMAANTFLLLKTVFTNPGYFLKNISPPDQTSSVMEINGISIMLKLCNTCNIIKAPRTHHCKICNFCVDRLDHHCPWVANCIGRKNHREFVMLLFLSTFESIYVALSELCVVFLLEDPPGILVGEIILILYGAVMF